MRPAPPRRRLAPDATAFDGGRQVADPSPRNAFGGASMSTAAFHRPSGRSVWTAKELTKSNDWLFQIPDTALREIEQELARLKTRGAKLEDIGAADFPLHSLDNQLKALKDEI